MGRFRSILFVAAAAGWLGSAAASAADPTARYFEALRERGLFRLAENYCLDRLKSPRATPIERAEWTIELARTLADHARTSSGEEQEQLWKRAETLLQEQLTKDVRNPRRNQIEAQAALLLTSRSEFLAAQAEAIPEDSAAVATAVTAARQAVGRLRSAEKIFAALALKLRANPSVAEGELSPSDVRSLLETLRFALANTLLDQARLAPRGSPDRASAAIDAEEILKRQAGGIPGDSLTWNARVLLAESARLKGDAKHVDSILTTLGANETPPAAILDRSTAIRARAALDAGKPDDAALAITQHFSRTKVLSGELHFLKALAVAGLADLALAKKDTGLADDLQKQLETQVSTVERDVGGWWGWRCQLVLERVKQSREYGPELATQVRRARAAWASGRRDEAIREFGAAAELAAKQKNEAVAIEMGFTRASILLQADQFDEAAKEFLALADDYPKSERAADSHLMSAYALGRLYEARATPERREAYSAALEAHRERFPESPTAHEARWMQGALQERRLQYTQAYRLYREIPAGHRRGPEAMVAVPRVLEAILARLREIRQPAAEWEKNAYERLEATRATFPAEPAPLSLEQAEAALRFGRLCLGFGRPDFVRADALLQRVLETSLAKNLPAESPASTEGETSQAETLQSFQRTARQLRVVSLAGLRRWPQADELVGKLSDATADETLGLIDGLARVGAAFDDAERRTLGELQLRLADRLSTRRDKLTPEQQRQLDEAIAQSLATSGQPGRAAAAYEALLKRVPKDQSLRKTYATFLMTSGIRDHLTKARNEWQTLESSAKAGERDWFEARLHLARCALLLGDTSESHKLLTVTRIQYPELGGAELAEKFRELEQSLQEKKK